MKEYMQCLKDSKYASEKCRHLSKQYLECRMDRCLSLLSICYSSLSAHNLMKVTVGDVLYLDYAGI